MVYSALHKLLRNQSQSVAKIITHFHSPIAPSPRPLMLTRIAKSLDQIPFYGQNGNDCPCPSRPSSAPQFYPDFSYGFFLNPIPPPPSDIRFEPDEEMPPDDSRTIRADSVKKKRKKKMNKHKLRKLRRCLRRKT